MSEEKNGLPQLTSPVPYSLRIRSGCSGGGKGALIQEDKSGTLACNNDQSLFVPYSDGEYILYLVRKLTPTECASLQGFPKDWCSLVPHKDTPEYKMWGNGMALPCVLYVMEGIARLLQRRELERLFGERGNWKGEANEHNHQGHGDADNVLRLQADIL